MTRGGLLTMLLALTAAGGASEAEEADYNRDVLPILAEHCFACHGPDDAAREAELRLDRRQAAIAEREGGPAVAPGDPDRSLLWRRILATDPSERMPPPETKKQLTPSQRETLRRWIQQGAAYQQHWAFEPLSNAPPPEVRQRDWPRNGIDAFVLARLEKERVPPSPPADRRTLARRASLDLRGAPPAPEELQRFLEDDHPQAYERFVDRLLASPQYGERWGRLWLDQARYADSHGYTIDGPRVMWPYRDWVIQALNQDMPFNRFTVEQLAGDLLPQPNKDQLVATGFHRNTLINQEGGTDNEQFRNEEVVDRVNTTGAVWLGLTLGCAQCHSHKFDPISQEEYFRLFAFFNHTRDVNNIGPTVSVREGELFLAATRREDLRALELAEANVARLERSAEERQRKWEQTQVEEPAERAPADWRPLRPAAFESRRGSPLRLLPDGSLLAERGAGNETYVVTLQPDPNRPLAALRLRVLPDDSLPRRGPGLASNGNFILTEFRLRIAGRPAPFRRAEASHAQPNYPIGLAIDGNPQTGWAINVGKGSAKKMNAEHEAWFVLEQPTSAADGPLTVVLEHDGNGAHYNIGRFALDGADSEPPPMQHAAVRRAAATPVQERDEQQRSLLAEAFAAADAELHQARREAAALRQRTGLGEPVATMIMQELPEPRTTYLHRRGDFLQPDLDRGPLAPGVPAVLPPLPAGAAGESGESPATRLDLARWLVDPRHPLTSRVTVNRAWMRFFGRGLVETENDFGTQGSYPTHPELLDWLSRQFIESGWSGKVLHRLIVTSAVYRQSSHARPDLATRDPRNLWLARQRRLRLDAELIRDAALTASGLLHAQVGGPSVHPPQPEGVYAFTQSRKNWPEEQGGARFRRAMYTMFYRSAPYPLLTTFDSPDFQSVCTARVRSNTPLQALTLANDAALFEMAEALAARVARELADAGRSLADPLPALQRMFAACYGRAPEPVELEACLEFLQLRRGDAEVLAAGHPAWWPADIEPHDRAAWTALARALMNTDEFITRE